MRLYTFSVIGAMRRFLKGCRCPLGEWVVCQKARFDHLTGQRFHLISLGCVKNTVDSENLIAELCRRGHLWEANPDRADWILVNTCGFIADARAESVRTLVAALARKSDRPRLRIAAFGCMVKKFEQELREALPELDLVFPFFSRDALLDAFPRVRRRGPVCHDGATRRLMPVHIGTLKVAEGCNNNCAYCMIPGIRGPLVSRALDDVVAEARALVDRGARELMLVAQDTTRFGVDRDGHCRLPELVTALAKLPEVVWIRLQYLHPARLTPALERAIFDCPKVVPYFDVPFQHTSDRILSLMGRGVTRRELIALLGRLRRRRGAVIRTTLMVGFPGETDDDFEAMLAFIEQHPIDRLGAFAFSNEPGTPAARIVPKVPVRLKRERLDRLMTLQQLLAAERQERMLGRRLPVMVDGHDEHGLYGRTAGDAPEVDNVVRLRYDEQVVPGTLVEARVVESAPYELVADIVRRLT